MDVDTDGVGGPDLLNARLDTIALSVTPLLYAVHRVVDGYLGKTETERQIEAVASTERADDAHVRAET